MLPRKFRIFFTVFATEVVYTAMLRAVLLIRLAYLRRGGEATAVEVAGQAHFPGVGEKKINKYQYQCV